MNQFDKVFYKIGMIVFIISGAVMLLISIARPNLSWLITPCVFKEMTGLYCPGCGGTRALRYMLGGRFLRSAYYHPMVMYGAGLYTVFMVTNTVQLLSRGKWKVGIHYRDLYVWLLLFILIANFIIKNLMLLVWNIRL